MTRVLPIDQMQPNTGRVQREDDTIINAADVITKEGFVGVEYLHNAVHEGKIFMVDTTKLAVADSGTFLVRVKTGPTKRLHFTIDWRGELKTRFKTYANPTTVTQGTPYTPFNRTPDSVETIETTIFLDPTFTGGILRGDQFQGTGGNVQTRAGGSASGGLESNFPPNTELIISLQNVGGAAADLGIVISMYEE